VHNVIMHNVTIVSKKDTVKYSVTILYVSRMYLIQYGVAILL